MPANILNLPCYKILGIQENEHDYHIMVEAADAPGSCPHCQHNNLVGFGRREQMLKDLPMHGRRVGIYIDTRRYRCRGCGKTFYELLPEIDEKRLMTKRLVQWMGKQAILRTFASIAEEVGCTEFTVRAVFNDYVNELEKTVRFETPKWMGIDEIHIINKPRCVVSNIQNNTIVDMLHNRNKDTVTKYLFKLPNRDKVQYVAMDMWVPYRDAVEAVLPNATIIIDKFHVVRMANDAMEKARKGLRAELTLNQKRGLMRDRFVLLRRERDLSDKDRLNLNGWTKNYPALGEAHRFKEGFFDIYEAGTPEDAMRRYEAWYRDIPVGTRPYFADLIQAFQNWMPYILNYFEHPVTNAYTESLNNLIRVMNRLGRGYSFEALRAKVLFTEGIHSHKQKRPRFERKHTRKPLPANTVDFFMSPVVENVRPVCPPEAYDPHRRKERGKNYGADISTLIRMIESGEL
ncbi:MAG: ISL3 family transposase [Betaproteobacteria bacterium]|nr:ISL3 family transposase [Betaproteobacteria bacterium]